jgi:hypothetical protein
MPLLDEKCQDPIHLRVVFLLIPMEKQSVFVYVDGFNFYYGLKSMATKDKKWKKF